MGVGLLGVRRSRALLSSLMHNWTVIEIFGGGGSLVAQCSLEAVVGPIDEEGNLRAIVVIQGGRICCKLRVIGATVPVILSEGM